jgi:uncharacterized protein (TIGR02594 family)
MTFDEWVISRLREHGCYAGSMNGAPGRAMIDGLKKLQVSVGLPVTGTADVRTVEALRAPGNSRDRAASSLNAPKAPEEPIWMREARRHLGVVEVAGTKANPVILGFAKQLGGWVASFYVSDETPWCGLGQGYCIAVTLPKEPLPGNPLSALAWKTFGQALSAPALGAILVFIRTGGGHVAQYAGEDDTHYHILGFNQSNSVTVARKAKSDCVAIRWPKTAPLPTGGRVLLTSAGVPISSNEA